MISYFFDLTGLLGYVWLANWAFQESHCLFAIKPKLHFWRHVLVELKEQLDMQHGAIVNPAMWDCQQNEDLIGKICSLAIKTDSRVQSQRVLEFYLFKASRLLEKHRLQNKS